MSGAQMPSVTVMEPEFPQELKDTGAKIYATYYTTRKDNAWAKANPDENPANVHYEFFPHRNIRQTGDPPYGSPVPGYAEGEHTR